MVSKSTKVTPQKTIGARFSNRDHVELTAVPLEGFENFGPKQNSKTPAKLRGDHAEAVVYRHFLDRGYGVLAHQQKRFGVEYDWIFQNDQEKVYVEVKSVKSADFYLERWPRRQRQRFLRVAAVLAERERSKFFLALVDYQDQVHLFQVGVDI